MNVLSDRVWGWHGRTQRPVSSWSELMTEASSKEFVLHRSNYSSLFYSSYSDVEILPSHPGFHWPTYLHIAGPPLSPKRSRWGILAIEVEEKRRHWPRSLPPVTQSPHVSPKGRGDTSLTSIGLGWPVRTAASNVQQINIFC